MNIELSEGFRHCMIICSVRTSHLLMLIYNNVTGDMPFGRQLQNFAQQKHQGGPQQQQQQQQGGKEPNLMPVPSPQQIQYLSTFEGQELTIQKQSNTSLRDSDIMSPLVLNCFV